MHYLIAIFFLFPCVSFSQITLDPVFSSHMLFQRDKPVTVFGRGVPGSPVKVLMGDLWSETTVGKDSSWIAKLNPEHAVSVPFSLQIQSKQDTFQLNDLLLGDVWLCIGQSNMEWPMQKELFFEQAISSADQPSIRFFNPSYAGKNVYGTLYTDSIVQLLVPPRFYSGKWQVCDSNSFRSMSAVAYYFGKMLHDTTGIPIGLINYSIGGAPLESFIDRNALEMSKSFSTKVKGDWLANEALPEWVRERGRQNIATKDVPSDANGKNHAFKPGFAYESGIKPLHSFPVKGILCYQGESNAQELERVMEYSELTILMVNDYRRKWNDTSLPFYFVQLSSIDTLKYKGQLWAVFRDQQRILQDLLPHSGMAVSSDLGNPNDVHPRNKRDIGLRLARWALYGSYGKAVVPSGPLPAHAVFRNEKVVVSFRFADGGLRTADALAPKGFSVDGITEISARMYDSTIEIDVPNRPVFIYYGWKPYSNGNIINSAGLPASSFKIFVQ